MILKRTNTEMGSFWSSVKSVTKKAAIVTALGPMAILPVASSKVRNLGKKLLTRKETWAAGLVAAGTALGVPPSVMVPLGLKILASGGKVPPGTDPKAAAAAKQYMLQKPPPGFWDRLLDFLGITG